MILRRIQEFFCNIFLEAQEDVVFEPLYCNLLDHYQGERDDLALDGIYVCVKYNEWVKELLRRAKYLGDRHSLELCIPVFERILDVLPQEMLNNPKTIITYVPMGFFAKIQRSFNQCEVFAKHIAGVKNISLQPLLTKVRKTKHQALLTKEERHKNPQDAYKVPTKYQSNISGKCVLLVDDVISTGSTLQECAKVLKLHGAAQVIALCLASHQE